MTLLVFGYWTLLVPLVVTIVVILLKIAEWRWFVISVVSCILSSTLYTVIVIPFNGIGLFSPINLVISAIFFLPICIAVAVAGSIGRYWLDRLSKNNTRLR